MNKIIYDFSRHNAKNAQHVQFVTDILVAVPEDVATQYGFAAQRSAFATAAEEEIACFKPDKGYLDTAKIAEADKKRDETYLFNKKIVEAYAEYCPDPELREAGKTAVFVFHEAGTPTELDYAGETATLTDVAGTLRQEPYISALTKIGRESAPDDIAEANDAFNQLYKTRTTEERKRAFASKLKTLRPVSDTTFDTLCETINAFYTVNELTTKDEATSEALGEVIDDVNDILVRLRKTISGEAPESPDEPETPENPDEQPGEGDGQPTVEDPDEEEDRPQVQ